MGGSRPDGLKLYNFVDNHDVERIYTKLNNKAHFVPVHILMYTLPGIPSVYYGSEFGIEGKKERVSDASLRPAIALCDYKDATSNNPCTKLIASLGAARQKIKALSYGEYKELMLTTRQYAFARNLGGQSVVVTVNNDDNNFTMTLPAQNTAEYIGVLSGEKIAVNTGCITVTVKGNSGEIWVPEGTWESDEFEVVPEISVSESKEVEVQPEVTVSEPEKVDTRPETPVLSQTNTINKPYEKMSVGELQNAIIERMAKNGPVTDRMRQDVMENVYHNSLVTWIKSFN